MIPATTPTRPKNPAPRITKTSAQRGCATPSPMKGKITAIVQSATKIPRAIPPAIYPTTNSSGLKGGINVSTILPCTFEITREEDVLAKAFWMTVIINIPGAMKCTNGTPITSPRFAPMASEKIAMNKAAVTKGARIVWLHTVAKRITSRQIKV